MKKIFLSLICFSLLLNSYSQTATPISSLPAVITPAGADVFPIVNTGSTRKMSLTQMAAYIGTVGGTVTSFSGVNNQGVSWSVATPTLTPAATLTLGAL